MMRDPKWRILGGTSLFNGRNFFQATSLSLLLLLIHYYYFRPHSASSLFLPELHHVLNSELLHFRTNYKGGLLIGSHHYLSLRIILNVFLPRVVIKYKVQYYKIIVHFRYLDI